MSTFPEGLHVFGIFMSILLLDGPVSTDVMLGEIYTFNPNDSTAYVGYNFIIYMEAGAPKQDAWSLSTTNARSLIGCWLWVTVMSISPRDRMMLCSSASVAICLLGLIGILRSCTTSNLMKEMVAFVPLYQRTP